MTVSSKALHEIMKKGYTTEETPGAMPNNSRVRKINSEFEDSHPDGAEGTVVGSLEHEGQLIYFVLWHDFSRPVGVLGVKLEEVSCS